MRKEKVKCGVLAYARVTHYDIYTTEFVLVYDHEYSMVFVQENPKARSRMLTKLHKSCGC